MKKERSIGIGKMRLTAVLLCLWSLIVISQEPTKENRKRAQQQPYKVVLDTTVTASRSADTLYLQQSLHLDRLDSLILEKQKR